MPPPITTAEGVGSWWVAFGADMRAAEDVHGERRALDVDGAGARSQRRYLGMEFFGKGSHSPQRRLISP